MPASKLVEHATCCPHRLPSSSSPLSTGRSVAAAAWTLASAAALSIEEGMSALRTASGRCESPTMRRRRRPSATAGGLPAGT
jgi:hypothetical protein